MRSAVVTVDAFMSMSLSFSLSGQAHYTSIDRLHPQYYCKGMYMSMTQFVARFDLTQPALQCQPVFIESIYNIPLPSPFSYSFPHLLSCQ